ncbi:sulfatase-like hydrolase/transferase [bacterium]|nr:sulfatase-like hydrolase/transferase [bacterium]
MRNPIHSILLSCCFLTIIFTQTSVAGGSDNTDKRPNIILINLDDADTDLLSVETVNAHFPALAELYQRSTNFTNAHSTTPFCAPSRAALFTGKYGFNNGCKTGTEHHRSSAGFKGGYQRFKSFNHDQNELGVWMKHAGYRTIHVGKFHHDGWDDLVPAGWDDFSADLGAKFYGTSRFTNINHSPPKRYGIGIDQYVTHEESREVHLALDNHDEHNPEQPFFLYLAPIAPHFPNSSDLSRMAAPDYRDYAEGLMQPRDTPDYDEADLSDKPLFLQREPLTETEEAHCQDAFIHRLRSMKSVDDMVGDLVNRLKQSGQWENTYLLLTSDNGYALGHHRLLYKKDPYERSSGIPLIAVSPASASQHIASHLIAHIDICPTILELGGATIPNDLDGKSFATLIDNSQSHSAPNWRRSIMIENWAAKGIQGQIIPMAYTAERFYDKIHIGWYNGEHEFYRMSYDPYQIRNVYNLLSDHQRSILNDSLLRFRQEDVLPNLTLTSPESGTEIDKKISFKGYMEDNSVPVLARLAVRSYQTKRFFNGKSWQDDFVALPISPSSLTSSINYWDYDLPIFSETITNADVLVSWVTPMDDSMRSGLAKFTVNSIIDQSMFAVINPTIDGKQFTGSAQRMLGFHGRLPGQHVEFSIIDNATQLYFNGETWQPEVYLITADNLPENRWSKTLRLGAGDYTCVAQAHLDDFFQAEPATATFTVRE